MTDLHAIDRAVSIARRRVFAQTWLTATGWSLLAGIGAAALALLVERLLAIPMPWLVFAVIGAVAMVVPIPIAASRRPTPQHTAVLIDERLHLKDRLSTALYARNLPDDPFAPQVIRDAQVAAASARVRDGFPVRLTRVWGWLLPAAAVLALLAVFVGPMDLLGIGRSRVEQQLAQEQAAAAHEQIVEAAAAIQQVQQDDAALDEIDPLSVMKEAASLTQRELTNPDYRQKAAAKLSAVEEKLAAAEQQKAREFESLQNALSRLDPGQPGAADRFADALRRGDFEAAKAALQSLAENMDELTPEQRDAAGQQLEALAQQLDEAARQAQQQQQQANEQIRKQLSDAGLSKEQIDEAQKQNFDAEHLQQVLERQGMSQQQAQQMAKQTQQQQQQSQSQKECQGQCNGLGQSLQQMANAMKSSQQQSQQGQQGQQGQQSQPGQQGQQGQQPSSGGGMESSSWQAQQQISEMGRMQQQLQQLRQSQQQAQQAMRQLQQQGQQPGNNQKPGQGGGVGGQKAGTGDGGNPFGAERSYQPQQVDAMGNIGEGEGRIIASWMQKGEAAPGEATVEFNAAVTEARDQAERAIADDRVPARYHEPVKKYFQQLPQSVDEVKKAPAAPR